MNSNETLNSVLKEVILFENNCEVGEGIQNAKHYKVGGYPTFIMVNPEGEVTSSWIGYPGPEKWAELARAGNKDRRTIEKKAVAFEEKATKELACSLANHASSTYAFADAVKYFRAARDLDSSHAGSYTQDILTNMYYGTQSGNFTLAQVTEEADFIMTSTTSSVDEKMNVAMMVNSMAKAMGQAPLAVPYIEQAMKASQGNAEFAEMRRELAIDHALLVLKDKEMALALKRESMPDDWQDDATGLNNFAWWCFENETNLMEAKTLAKRGVELADSDGLKANILDTEAELCAALGDTKGALKLIEKAIDLDGENGHYQRQKTRFEDELKK